ncbi:hypothetical protein ACIBO1_09625 [Micromonospora sp. NPDC049903]|uniref:hypothetical protein n=1 Tax=Micromonospora sp. NPDC049903 TaxID=3364276 RepID=UPI0037A3A924
MCVPRVAPAPPGLAALHLGRRYQGIDINPAFHDEALHRLTPHLPDDSSHEDGG